MDYDRVYKEDPNRKSMFSDENGFYGQKLMVGKISLQNAMIRIGHNELYVLVTYNEGEQLPKEYRPVETLKSDDGTLFATINTQNTKRINFICRNGIQMVTQLRTDDEFDPKFLLGPGPETVLLSELIEEQYKKHFAQGNTR